MKYISHLKARIQNPLGTEIFDENSEMRGLKNVENNSIKKAIHNTLSSLEMDLSIIRPIPNLITPQWNTKIPFVDISMIKYSKRWCLDIQNAYLQLLEKYTGFNVIYTDASKLESSVGCAVYVKENQLQLRNCNNNS